LLLLLFIVTIMIGKIKGTLVEIDGREGLVETAGGVSYRILLSPSFLLQEIPSSVDIYTHLQIREDAHVLYGFDSKDQYRMFHMLLAVDGVGPKTAHTVVSSLPVIEIMDAVHDKKVDALTAISGLGKKTAQKIILELSGKMKTEFDISSIIEEPIDNDALDALVSLGYKVNEAKEMLKPIDSSLSVEKKIQQALRKHV
jgi:holliday junction DNA helicase RuvA